MVNTLPPRFKVLVFQNWYCNSVAHSLAKQVKLCPYLLLWMKDAPPEIYYVLQVDLNSFL